MCSVGGTDVQNCKGDLNRMVKKLVFFSFPCPEEKRQAIKKKGKHKHNALKGPHIHQALASVEEFLHTSTTEGRHTITPTKKSPTFLKRGRNNWIRFKWVSLQCCALQHHVDNAQGAGNVFEPTDSNGPASSCNYSPSYPHVYCA